jgi:hypothetical protein
MVTDVTSAVDAVSLRFVGMGITVLLPLPSKINITLIFIRTTFMINAEKIYHIPA